MAAAMEVVVMQAEHSRVVMHWKAPVRTVAVGHTAAAAAAAGSVVRTVAVDLHIAVEVVAVRIATAVRRLNMRFVHMVVGVVVVVVVEAEVPYSVGNYCTLGQVAWGVVAPNWRIETPDPRSHSK